MFRQTKAPLIVANRLTESAQSQTSFKAFLCTLSKIKKKYLVRIEEKYNFKTKNLITMLYKSLTMKPV